MPGLIYHNELMEYVCLENDQFGLAGGTRIHM